TMLNPDLLIGDAPIGSGFLAEVINVGANTASVGTVGAHPAVLITVVSGPAAGQEFPLPIGHFMIGRDAGNDVTLVDPLVSKRHARIEVASTFVEIVDLNSANGILVDGGLVQRLRVIPGQSFVLGDSELVVRLVSDFDGTAAEADPVLERGGALLFNRSPRVEERYSGEELPEPRYPRDQVQRLFPWPMLVAPIVLGVAVYFMMNNPRALLMIVMTPMMMLGNFISQRTNIGQRLRKEEASFEE